MTEELKVTVTNPLLERARIPGETFTLPSLGLFYNGELSPDVDNGEIYINPMTTLDEIILKSPDKLYSGEGINDVFKRCIPQVLKPLDLLAKDVDFILTALRKISFGNTTEIELTHNCEKAKKHNYNLDMSKFISKTIKLDPTSIKKDYIKVLKNGQTIKLSPPTFSAALKIYQVALDNNPGEDNKQVENDILESISTMIKQVDEINDNGMIVEWLRILKPEIINEIKDLVGGLTDWGTDFNSKIKCKDCGKEVDITSEINPVSFFF